MIRHLTSLQASGVDQVILMQQAGRNSHENITDSMKLFADKVMPQFKAVVAEREASKAKELALYIEAALARKPMMQAPSREDTPVVKAAVRASKPGTAQPSRHPRNGPKIRTQSLLLMLHYT